MEGSSVCTHYFLDAATGGGISPGRRFPLCMYSGPPLCGFRFLFTHFVFFLSLASSRLQVCFTLQCFPDVPAGCTHGSPGVVSLAPSLLPSYSVDFHNPSPCTPLHLPCLFLPPPNLLVRQPAENNFLRVRPLRNLPPCV